MTGSSWRMRARDGFSLFELFIVLLIVGIVAAVSIPTITRGIGGSRAQRAATVIAADLQLAHSLAGRQRRPIQIRFDTAAKIMRVRDSQDSSRVYSIRYFNSTSEMPVQSMVATPVARNAFPNGLMDGSLDVTINISGERRRVTMTRVGQVRIVVP